MTNMALGLALALLAEGLVLYIADRLRLRPYLVYLAMGAVTTTAWAVAVQTPAWVTDAPEFLQHVGPFVALGVWGIVAFEFRRRTSDRLAKALDKAEPQQLEVLSSNLQDLARRVDVVREELSELRQKGVPAEDQAAPAPEFSVESARIATCWHYEDTCCGPVVEVAVVIGGAGSGTVLGTIRLQAGVEHVQDSHDFGSRHVYGKQRDLAVFKVSPSLLSSIRDGATVHLRAFFGDGAVIPSGRFLIPGIEKWEPCSKAGEW